VVKEAFLKIRNWDKWQSYRRDRGQPPWIKIHREIMRNLEWVSLSDSERGQLIALWLLAADHNGQIPSSPLLVMKLCFMTSKPDINKFIDLGFIEPCGRHLDVTVTPERRQHDVTETETETDISSKSPIPDDPWFDAEFWPMYPWYQLNMVISWGIKYILSPPGAAGRCRLGPLFPTTPVPRMAHNL